jgi:hypothetical protein
MTEQQKSQRRSVTVASLALLAVMILGAVVCLAAVIAIPYSFHVVQERRDACEARGGTYVELSRSSLCQRADGRVEKP